VNLDRQDIVAVNEQVQWVGDEVGILEVGGFVAAAYVREGRGLVGDGPAGHDVAEEFLAVQVDDDAVVAHQVDGHVGEVPGVLDGEGVAEVRRDVLVLAVGPVTDDGGFAAVAVTEFAGPGRPGRVVESREAPARALIRPVVEVPPGRAFRDERDVLVGDAQAKADAGRGGGPCAVIESVLGPRGAERAIGRNEVRGVIALRDEIGLALHVVHHTEGDVLDLRAEVVLGDDIARVGVGPDEGQVLAVGIEFEVGVKVVGMGGVAARQTRGEDDQVIARAEGAGGERPLTQVLGVVGQVPALQVDRRDGGVVDLDPVPVGVGIGRIPRLVVVGHELGDQGRTVEQQAGFHRFEDRNAGPPSGRSASVAAWRHRCVILSPSSPVPDLPGHGRARLALGTRCAVGAAARAGRATSKAAAEFVERLIWVRSDEAPLAPRGVSAHAVRPAAMRRSTSAGSRRAIGRKAGTDRQHAGGHSNIIVSPRGGTGTLPARGARGCAERHHTVPLQRPQPASGRLCEIRPALRPPCCPFSPTTHAPPGSGTETCVQAVYRAPSAIWVGLAAIAFLGPVPINPSVRGTSNATSTSSPGRRPSSSGTEMRTGSPHSGTLGSRS